MDESNRGGTHGTHVAPTWLEVLIDKRSFATLVNSSMLGDGDDPKKVVNLTNTTIALVTTEQD